MAAKGWRTVADIDGKIENGTPDHAHELALRMWCDLKMQPAQYALAPAERVVVLHEGSVDANVRQGLALIGLRKEAALIAENRWCDELQLWNRERFNLHASCPFGAVTLARRPGDRQGRRLTNSAGHRCNV